MAKLTLRGRDLVVELSSLEKLGALSSGVTAPLASVRDVRVTEKPYKELRGVRVGTGVPFAIVLGRMYYRGGKDFVAVYGSGRTAIIELDETQPYKRIFVSGVGDLVLADVKAAVRAERDRA